MKRTILLTAALIPLAGCSLFQTTPKPIEETEQALPIAETKNVIYRGVLLPLGASIYMEGSHRLELEDGRFILLEGNGLLLDEYLKNDVEVFGATRPTIEGGAIIMRVDRIAKWFESSSAPSVDSSSSDTPSSVPAAISSIAPTVSSRPAVPPPTPVSSKAPPIVVSSTAPIAIASSSDGNAALTARAATMAKANMATANWTGRYCNTYIEFCFPVHKNWYYKSFSTVSGNVWHVEVSSEELSETSVIGDGPISVILVSGNAPGPDGHVVIENGKVTGYRAWTKNRHFVISAPANLEAAVRTITQELTATSAASSSAPGAGA